MTCPRCAAAEISPITGKCDLCGFALAAAVTVAPVDGVVELATRQLAHEFRFSDLVGRGRDTAVFSGTEIQSGRKVMVKAIARRADDLDAAESFRSTMLAFQQVDHPHVIPVLRFGSTDSLFWFASDDRGAISMRAGLQASGPLDAKGCRRILTQLVSALDHLHRRGLVHGSVKPENVLLDQNGWIGLIDPSVFRPRPRRPSRQMPAAGSTPVMGNPTVTPTTGAPAVAADTGREPWIAPEELSRGERVAASDQYALGALAFELLTGQPFVLGQKPLSDQRPDVPIRHARAIERALSIIPTQRFASCTDFLFALEEDAAVAPSRPSGRVTAEIVTVRDWEPPRDPRERFYRTMKFVAVGLLVAVVAVAIPLFKELFAPVPVTPVGSDGAAPTSSAPSSPATSRPDPVVSRPPSRESLSERSSRAASARGTEPAATAPAPAPVAPVASAHLFVNATPWGQVFLDGTNVGNTPRANLPVTPGAHTLRVARDGFTPWERNFRIAAGDTLRFVDIVLAPITP